MRFVPNLELVKAFAEWSEAGIVASSTVTLSRRGFMAHTVVGLGVRNVGDAWQGVAVLADVNSEPLGTIEWE